MVPGLDADALVDALALRVSASGVSLRRPGLRERPARSHGGRVRAAGHRCVRRGPLLGHHRRLREGGARRSLHPHDDPQRGPRAGQHRRAPDAVVPQPLVVGPRRDQAEDRRDRRRAGRPITPTWAGSCSRETATPSRCSATTRATCIACGAATGRRIPRTGSTTTSSTAGRPSIRPGPAPRLRCTMSSRWTAAGRSRSACGSRPSRGTSPTRGRTRCARGRRTPTTSTRRSRRPRPPTSSW